MKLINHTFELKNMILHLHAIFLDQIVIIILSDKNLTFDNLTLAMQTKYVWRSQEYKIFIVLWGLSSDDSIFIGE